MADSSLVSPTYLFIASKTALTLNRVEDAGFLFYAAQLRTAFDFERYDAPGSPTATMPRPISDFSADDWRERQSRHHEGTGAFHGRVEPSRLVGARALTPGVLSGVRVEPIQDGPETWAASAAALKATFMERFGRRQERLLNDPRYFAAFRFVQSLNFGELPLTPENRARMTKSAEAMEAAEQRLFPAPAPPTAPLAATPAAPSSPARADTRAPVRVGPGVRNPRSWNRVEPEFRSGVRGSAIMEVTIGERGRVTGVRFLRNEPALDAAAEKAVRQWIFAPTLIDGPPAFCHPHREL